MATIRDFRVVVVGGGLVGAATALALGRHGVATAVVEPSPPGPIAEDEAFRLRVSAVGRGSRHFLAGLGGWPGESPRLCPFTRVAAWDRQAGGRMEFRADDGAEPLGHIVENDLLQHHLYTRSADLETVTWLTGAAPAELDPEAGALTLDDGTRLAAELIVGADGARSLVREAAGLRTERRPYDQHALVATVTTVAPQQAVTWQRFTPHGPQAFLPLPGHHASLVWYDSPEAVEARLELDHEALRAEIEADFPGELGGLERVDERGAFPIQRLHAERYFSGRVALVGDAAHVIHPLAGQGVNLGFRDAEALAATVADALAAGLPASAPGALARYESRRRLDNQLMQSVMEGLHRGFTSTAPAWVRLRGWGLWAAERAGPLKRLALAYACGEGPPARLP